MSYLYIYKYPIITPLGMVFDGRPIRSILRSPRFSDMLQTIIIIHSNGSPSDTMTISDDLGREALAV